MTLADSPVAGVLTGVAHNGDCNSVKEGLTISCTANNTDVAMFVRMGKERIDHVLCV